MAAAAASSLDRNYKCDVFVSFRGSDTREIFIGHLHEALERKLLTAFIVNEDLPKGEVIQVLLKAIEDSKLSVVVFSENYAFSRWCLKELAQIVECMDTMKQIVVPIFYQVDPADVRYQKKKFEDAFAEHEHQGRETPEVLKSWKSALNRVADLSGWDSCDFKDDAQLIEKVVEDVFQKLIKIRSSKSEDDGLVAMEDHMKEMELLLRGNNSIVGIWGMGGLGKTTIARAVYHKFTCNFDACCFLENVRHEFKAKGGAQLQEVLLYKLLREKVRNLGTTDTNSVMINAMLRKKKLFIVLDDVDDIAQVAALLGDYHSFTGESRIIITTRDESVLSEFPIYRPKPLGYVEALELFKKHAKPSEEYDILLGRAIEYTKGLPLAIKVLGASLRAKSISEWDDELKKVRNFQDKSIEGVLRTSFDGLDDTQKTIFLDVACFFKGNNKEYVTTVLDACHLFPESGLKVLIDRALITISPYPGGVRVLGMHGLLQAMARGIVRSTKSRLTPLDDIVETLIENEATAAVESIDLDLQNIKDVHINPEAFVSMRKLRLLKIHYGSSEELYNLSGECKQTVSGDLQSLSRELRCLIWHGYPLKSLPSRFHTKHLVDIDMRCSTIIQLWEGIQPLGKLKYIDLSRCLCLREIPDLSEATNLEKVNLEGCISLSEVHSSISDLKHLAFLNLKGCRKLETLPSSISMTSLETLELSGCSNFKIFPEISEVIKKLPRLCLDMTAIKKLPSSIKNLKGLVTLSLKDCRELETLPRSICQLKSLRYVTLSGCSKFKVFPKIVGPEDMSSLIELHLDGTSIKEFLPSTSALESLRVLSLRDCKELKTLPSSIRMDYLESLFLSGCSNLQKFPHISETMYFVSELHLDEIAIEELPPSIINLLLLRYLIVRDCGEIKSLPRSIFKLCHLKEITLSGCSKFEVFPEFVEELCRDKNNYWFSSLVTLRLEDCGELKSLPSSIFLLESLRFVSLSGCSKFEVFPEIYEYGHVRELHLDGTSIKDLPPSIERLKSIMLLNMSNCRSLVSLPDNICNLSDLTGLTLTGCSNLHNLPIDLENKLEFLLDLDIEGSGIKQPLPPLRLMRSPSSATDCLVGMDGHIEQMETLLCLGEAKDVVTVGIWGRCGIGKTTLASVVYKKIAPQFEHCCFLESVNEGFENHGAVYMQEKLLSTVLNERVQSSGILNGDSNVMMERLRMKRVLLVLDDIHDITQIEILLGKPYALGDGSRIIITTRREELESISRNYCPKLSDDEALELFRKFAIGTIKPSDEYYLLSQRAIACAQGLPLALKVLGYLLSGTSISQWDDTLKSIEFSRDGVEQVFLESISALPDPERFIFLDVACFLKGREKDYVTEILRSCGFFPYSGLRSLIDRGLLAISHWDKSVKMYDSMHEAGRETVQLTFSYIPEQRGRLWASDGIRCLSSDYVATNAVEAIDIDLSNSKEIHFKAEAFVSMKRLRLLQILDEGFTCKQTVSENVDVLSHELRCLIWHRCPLRSLPSNFHPWNLVELDMRGSLIEKLRGETKFLRNLKFINLSHCPYLKKIPDLSKAKNLKKLVLDGCTSLIELHPSIWDHKNLVLLSLKGCQELEIVLDSIHMISLKTLNLSGCSKFEKFPDVLGVMMELAELGLDETAIKELPSSIQHLQGLNLLSLGNCTSLVSLPNSICRLEHLRFLNLVGCSKLSGFPDSLRNKQSLIISGIELFPLMMRSKETEAEGVIGVLGQGSSSESGQGRKLPAVEEAQRKRERECDKEKEIMEGSSSESGQGRKLPAVEEAQRKRERECDKEKEVMEVEVQEEQFLAGGRMLGALCGCLSCLGELLRR